VNREVQKTVLAYDLQNEVERFLTNSSLRSRSGVYGCA
jgi:hypothetical protein